MSVKDDLTHELTAPGRREERIARLEQIEDEIFQTCAQLGQAFLAIGEISPDQAEPPESWVAEFGPEAAKRRLILAKLGWAPHSQMPGAVKIAGQFLAGSMRSRATRVEKGPRVLNVKIALPAPTSAEHPEPGQAQYPQKEIE